MQGSFPGRDDDDDDDQSFVSQRVRGDDVKVEIIIKNSRKSSMANNRLFDHEIDMNVFFIVKD